MTQLEGINTEKDFGGKELGLEDKVGFEDFRTRFKIFDSVQWWIMTHS